MGPFLSCFQDLLQSTPAFLIFCRKHITGGSTIAKDQDIFFTRFEFPTKLIYRLELCLCSVKKTKCILILHVCKITTSTVQVVKAT